ncbi:hypothetical protein ACLEJW_21970 [Pseudomonas sp. SMSB3]|uniref:hypothetical protein n=1 Tax=Pseudomonas sp. SMSB3 TaxID=3390196 RepID=UPI003F870CE5
MAIILDPFVTEKSNAILDSNQAVQGGKLRSASLVSISILVAVASRVVERPYFAVMVD